MEAEKGVPVIDTRLPKLLPYWCCSALKISGVAAQTLLLRRQIQTRVNTSAVLVFQGRSCYHQKTRRILVSMMRVLVRDGQP